MKIKRECGGGGREECPCIQCPHTCTPTCIQHSHAT